VIVLAGAAAVLANFGSAAPTGIRLVDIVYIGLAGGALALAASRSRRWAWIISSVLALWLTDTTPGRIAAVLAIALGIYAVQSGRRRSLGAAIGALLAFSLAHLGAGPFTGSTLLLVILAAAPMLGSGLWLMPKRWRRQMLRSSGITVATAALSSAIFGLSAMLAIGDVGDGVDFANQGFDLVADTDQSGAARAFDASSGSFESARSKVSGFWTLPARLVPVVGQHVRAVQVVAAEGVALTNTARETARSIDPNDVRLIDGGLDLDLIRDLEPVLFRAERALERAHSRVTDSQTVWLLPPLDDRLQELIDELDDARPAAHTAALAASELPAMLGADGTVRWIVAMTTPAEARGLGGLLGNWALVEATNGQLSIALSGRNEDINQVLRAREVELRGPEQYVERWGRFAPNEFFQDVTLSPDLPMTAEVTANLFNEALDLSVDGVIFVDPYAIAAVLQLSGPIVTDERTLNSRTIVPFLLDGQYHEFEDDDAGRVAALAGIVEGTFSALTSGELPGPRSIADVMGPIIEQDRLGVWWAEDDGARELIDDVGLDGRFPVPTSGDLLALVHQNAGQNKLDPYLRREMQYSLVVERGQASATITIDLYNDLSDLSLPAAIIENNDQGYPAGTNVVRLFVHTALNLQSARLDGEPFNVGRGKAFGYDAIEALVEIPPGGHRQLEIDVSGVLRVSPSDYAVTLPHQPLVNSDIITLDVTIDGDTLDLGDPLVLEHDFVVTAPTE
jgi:hypothetical protein